MEQPTSDIVIRVMLGGPLADAISGGTDGRPIWSRIFFITSVSLIAEMILTLPPQTPQVSTSMSKTRLRSLAQVTRLFLARVCAFFRGCELREKICRKSSRDKKVIPNESSVANSTNINKFHGHGTVVA